MSFFGWTWTSLEILHANNQFRNLCIGVLVINKKFSGFLEVDNVLNNGTGQGLLFWLFENYNLNFIFLGILRFCIEEKSIFLHFSVFTYILLLAFISSLLKTVDLKWSHYIRIYKLMYYHQQIRWTQKCWINLKKKTGRTVDPHSNLRNTRINWASFR